MLEETDRGLGRREERNGEGVKRVPVKVRAELREVVEAMPNHVREPLRDGGQVQDTLDSLFEVQERLFRWRYPDWQDIEPPCEGEGEGDVVYASEWPLANVRNSSVADA